MATAQLRNDSQQTLQDLFAGFLKRYGDTLETETDILVLYLNDKDEITGHYTCDRDLVDCADEALEAAKNAQASSVCVGINGNPQERYRRDLIVEFQASCDKFDVPLKDFFSHISEGGFCSARLSGDLRND